MTVQARFERACRSYDLGEREDIENYPDVPAAPAYARVREVAEELLADVRRFLPRLPPIHFDFIHDPTVNAYAFRFGGEYFIGMNSGTLLMLHLVVQRMLASPNVLSTIGRPAAEAADIPVVDWSNPDVQALHANGVVPVLPRDSGRRAYADHIVHQGLLFIIGHEIAHITRGHVDFLGAHSGAIVTELGWRGSSSERIIRQAIETDADGRSVFARLFSAMGTARSAPNQRLPWTTRPAGEVEWNFDWSFAVSVFFRLFGDQLFSRSELSTEGYPPLALRQVMAVASATQDVASQFGDAHALPITRALWSAIHRADEAFVAIGAPAGGGGVQAAMERSSFEHIERITTCWNSILPELQQHSVEELHPKVARIYAE